MTSQPNRGRWIDIVLRDGWRIDAKIARGGVATVFRASNAQGERAAVKILHPELAQNHEVKQRFLKEGFAANTVGHPGVVRVLSHAVADDGSAYLVMELLEGKLLEDRRTEAGGTLPLDEVLDIADQLLDVLAVAHDKGIVHRDLKPENLFVVEGGQLKVLDFGIAHIRETLLERDTTQTGVLIGTPDFMSPEQAGGKSGQIDAQTDVWAVGATLFTLLSGKPVHDAASIPGLLFAAASRPARSLGSVVKNVPPAVVAVVDRALSLDKTGRWPSARTMKEALRGAIPRVSSSAQAAPTPSTSSDVNDDKKATNPNASPGPGAAPGTAEGDDNPWDDDDGGGRTLATEGPSFEMPSNIPSPITNPPPAMNPGKPVIPKIDFGKPPSGESRGSLSIGKPMPAAPLGGGTVQGLGFPETPPLPGSGPSPAAGVAPGGASPPSPPSPPSGNMPRRPPPPIPSRVGAPAPPSARMPVPPIVGRGSVPQVGRGSVPDAGQPSGGAGPAGPKPGGPSPMTPASASALGRAPVDPDDEDGRSDDGPTMAIASPALSGPLRDDVANPRPLAKTAFGLGPSAPGVGGAALAGLSGVDKDAETMSLSGSDLPPRENDIEETTRAVSRDELIRHQDAQLIVGDDAHGDEATLAVPPGQIEGLDPAIAAALSDALKQREPANKTSPTSPSSPLNAPAFAPPSAPFPGSSMQGPVSGGPMGGPMGGSSGHLAAAPPASQGYANAPPPQSWGGQGMPPSFDPMMPHPQHQGGFPPPSNPNPGQQTQNMTGGSNPHLAAAATSGGGPPSQQMQMQMQQPQMQQPHMQPPHMQQQQRGMGNPQPWMTQPTPPPAGMTGPSRFTPQVILLVAVGVVCLAIFIVGIVLFVTTKF